MPLLQKALFAVPFPDFDYEKLAKDCGCSQSLHASYTLIVVGSASAMLDLTANLGWGPDFVQDVPAADH